MGRYSKRGKYLRRVRWNYFYKRYRRRGFSKRRAKYLAKYSYKTGY